MKMMTRIQKKTTSISRIQRYFLQSSHHRPNSHQDKNVHIVETTITEDVQHQKGTVDAVLVEDEVHSQRIEIQDWDNNAPLEGQHLSHPGKMRNNVQYAKCSNMAQMKMTVCFYQ